MAALMSVLLTACAVMGSIHGFAHEIPVPDIPWESVTGTKVVRSAIEINNIVEGQEKALVRRIVRENRIAEKAMDEQMQALYDELTQEIDARSGSWSLYLKRLDDGQVIGIDQDKPMVAASLIKLFIAGAFYSAAQQGDLNAGDFGDSPDVMLSRSDNAAANRLIDALGKDRINAFIKHWRITPTPGTILNRKMLEDNGTENYTTAEDCGRMLESVLKGQFVSEEASERILEDLKAQERTSKIPAGVPEDIQTANKTGELVGVDNDAAIIWGPDCTYILCIMSRGGSGAAAGITKLSQIAYDNLCRKP